MKSYKLLNKIKVKWTIFILFLLVINFGLLSVFMLNGIFNNQKKTDETILLENSKLANLYIRELYISRDDSDGVNLDYGSLNDINKLKEMDFKTFYEQEAYSLSVAIERMVHLPVAFYSIDGKLLDGSFKEILGQDEVELLNRSLKNEIVYEKRGDEIFYFAPIYDFENQIGVMKLVYSTYSNRIFYNEIKYLFIKIGILSLIITGGAGVGYFSKVSKEIDVLKKNIKSIEAGDYQLDSILETNDELEELSRGIYYAAGKIDNEVNALYEEKQKLELAINKLQKLEKQQKIFIGDTTHEFKTPLTVIKAQMDLMTLYRDDEVMTVKAKEIAEKEIKRLDNMVAKTLYLSRLEKYDFERKLENVNMDILLDDICQRMEGKANKFNISIIRDLKPWIFVRDSEQMMQIIINLIDNAIKYNEVGGKIFVRNYFENKKHIIEIEDTGIGISANDKKHIFKPFYVVDKNRSKKFSGTGLGLALVKKLICAQGGDIDIKDGLNGTIFKISI